jgi:hypothetical protein
LMTFLKYLQLNWFFWAQIFACFWPEKYDLHNKIDEAAKFTSQDVLWTTWLHQILGQNTMYILYWNGGNPKFITQMCHEPWLYKIYHGFVDSSICVKLYLWCLTIIRH